MKRLTKDSVSEKMAESLREFGYPDVTTQMIRECLDAWLNTESRDVIPHGVIGMFAIKQFEEFEEALPKTMYPNGLADLP